MNLKRIATSLLMISMAAAAAMSCKDDDDDEYPSLDGTLAISGSKVIVSLGDTLRFTADGIIEPDEDTVAYTWKVTSDLLEEAYSMTATDEEHSFMYVFSEGLGTYTVTCTASCSGYYSSTATASVTTVKSGIGGSVPQAYYADLECEKVKDSDGTVYNTTSDSDGQVWINRNYADKSAGVSYREYEELDGLFGRYYTYEEAVNICPEGYHLPTDAEWMQAAQTLTDETLEEHAIWPGVAGAFMTDGYFNEYKMWEYWPAVKITNKIKFNILPTGYCDPVSGIYGALYNVGVFWTADKIDETHAICREFIVDQPDVHPFAADTKAFGASVRCVK